MWAGPVFADYVCYLWDDLYADLHCYGTPVAELSSPERLQRAAAAVVSLRAVAPPFAAGLVDHATPRFAAVLLSVLRASNAAAGSAVPLVPTAGGTGGTATAGGRHARAPSSRRCAAVCGPRGSSSAGSAPGTTPRRGPPRAPIRGRRRRRTGDDAAADLFDDVLRRFGTVHGSTPAATFSTRATNGPTDARRAGVGDDGTP